MRSPALLASVPLLMQGAVLLNETETDADSETETEKMQPLIKTPYMLSKLQ